MEEDGTGLPLPTQHQRGGSRSLWGFQELKMLCERGLYWEPQRQLLTGGTWL